MNKYFILSLSSIFIFCGAISLLGYKIKNQATPIQAQGAEVSLVNPPEAVGPELAFFDPGGQQQVYTNVVAANNFTGAVQAANDVNGDPYNPAPGTSVTLRLVAIRPDTPIQTMVDFANKLNAFDGFPAGTVVIVGNELNNLDKEYPYPGAVANDPASLRAAAWQYGAQYIAFAQAIDHSKYQVSPAPPDLYNANWDPVVWVEAFNQYLNQNGGCAVTDTLIANVFDVPSRVGLAPLETYKYLEQKICSGLTVKRFGGWGAWPEATIAEQVEFYNTTPLPAGVTEATTLIADNCDGAEGFATDTWLYYILGKVYRADGTEVDPETCSSLSERKFTLEEVACNATQDPEFHSLRPYPASPTCKPAPEGVFLCGNDLIVRHTYTLTPEDGTCTPEGGQLRCEFNVSGSADVYIDSTKGDFPIAGNTEKVPNAVTSVNRLLDPERVNEYASWYLNGVIGRGEEPLIGSNNSILSKVINFSGPLNKLLPREVQSNLRQNQRAVAGNVGEIGRHNQIAYCESGGTLVPCYASEEQSRVRIKDSRLDIGTTYGPWRLALPSEGVGLITRDIIETPPPNEEYIPYSSTEDRTGQLSLGNKNPNQERSDPVFPIKITNVKYSPITHEFAAEESRKNLFFAHLAELDQLSNTLQLTYKPFGYTGLEGEWSDTEKLNAEASAAYCEKLEGRDNDGDKLYGENKRTGGDAYLEIKRFGQVVQDPMIKGNVTYDANFGCYMPIPVLDQTCYDQCIVRPSDHDPNVPNGHFTCVNECTPDPECEVAVPVGLSVSVQTPKENDTVWNRLVAANMSFFRRIFPRIEEDSTVTLPLEEIEDIPGKTDISYGASNHSSTVGELEGESIAGDPTRARPGSQAQIFFPHLGSIQEYFLYGVQEALRPYGTVSIRPGTSPGGPTGGNYTGDYCNTTFMSDAFGGDAQGAACICNKESGGNANALNDSCKRVGGSYDYSVGLFQINMLAHCPQGFDNVGDYVSQGGILRTTVACQPGTGERKEIFDDCLERFSNPELAKDYARYLAYETPQGWSHWSTSARACRMIN